MYVLDSHIRARHHNRINSIRQIFENMTLSACRQMIEWDNGDIVTLWAYLDFKKNLKIRGQYIREAFLTGLVLRNLYTTMNGNTSCDYFNIAPPSFALYTAAGPRIIPPAAPAGGII
jgi:hypothetical protein